MHRADSHDLPPPPFAHDQGRVALALAVIVMAIFLVLAGLPHSMPPRPLSLLPETIAAYGFVDSSRQLQAHRIVVALLAAGTLFAGWLARQARSDWARFDGTVPPLFGVALLALPLMAWVVGLGRPFLAAFVLFVLLTLGLPLLLRGAHGKGVLALIVLAYAAVLVLPGYAGPIMLVVEAPYDLAQIELHLAALVLPSSILAAGYRLFQDITPEYGVLLPVLAAPFERHLGFLDVAAQVRLTQASQVAFLALAAIVLYRVRGRLLPALLPLAMVGPYLSTAGPALWHPNQSGLRHLGFPLGLLVLQAIGGRKVDRQALALGFAGAWLLLLNFETGVSLLCGFGFYLYLRSQPSRMRELARVCAWTAVGFVAALALFSLVHRLGLGSWLTLPDLLKGARDFLLRATRGFSGLPLFTAGHQNVNLAYIPVALAMLFHSSYLVLLSVLRARCRALKERELFLAATSLILIVWLGYYINFPSWWNLWVPLFLYGAILASRLDARRLRCALARPASVARRPWGALAILLVLMVCAVSHVDLIAFNHTHLAPGWRSKDPGASVSGIRVPTPLAGELIEKAAYLERAAGAGRVAYATVNNDFMPVLSGVYQAGMQRNFWGLASSEDDIRRTIAGVAQANPHRLLIDADSGPLAVAEPRRAYQQRIRRVVSERFDLAGQAAGWEIWVPKTAVERR